MKRRRLRPSWGEILYRVFAEGRPVGAVRRESEGSGDLW
jgi:hypothetical protein